MATVSGNASMESRQLFGGFIPDGDGGYGWIDGPVTDVVRNGGVLLLDEMNFISPKIYTTLYPLTDGRRSITLLDHMGETIVAHEDLTIFATMNPDYIGTTPLNFAMRNRFDIHGITMTLLSLSWLVPRLYWSLPSSFVLKQPRVNTRHLSLPTCSWKSQSSFRTLS